MSDQACWNYNSFLKFHSFFHSAKPKILISFEKFPVKYSYQIVLLSVLPLKIDINFKHLPDMKMYIENSIQKIWGKYEI